MEVLNPDHDKGLEYYFIYFLTSEERPKGHKFPSLQIPYTYVNDGGNSCCQSNLELQLTPSFPDDLL